MPVVVAGSPRALSARRDDGSLSRLRRPAPRPTPAQAPAGSGSCRPLFPAVHDDAVDDVHTQGEDAKRPPRVGAADRQQRPDRTEAAADDADYPTVDVASHQREPSAELDHAEND